MILKKSILAVWIGAVFAGSALAETLMISEPEARVIVTKSGYSDPVLIERDGNFWRMSTTASNSTSPVTVFVDSQGKILGAADVSRTRVTDTQITTTTTTDTAAPVTEASVSGIVMKAGFHNVHDVDYLKREGVWKAEADDISGDDFEIHVDAVTGRIVHIEDD